MVTMLNTIKYKIFKVDNNPNCSVTTTKESFLGNDTAYYIKSFNVNKKN